MPSFDRRGFVVIPPKQLKKVYGLPENKLDSFSSQLTTIQAQYTVEDMDIIRNPFHAKILSNQLPKNLDELTKGMAEELALAFEKYWGSSTSWKSVHVWSSSASIIARSMNRVFVGEPLCMCLASFESTYLDTDVYRSRRGVYPSAKQAWNVCVR
jgi:hypothetical protein